MAYRMRGDMEGRFRTQLPNPKLPIAVLFRVVGCWMLDVQCWVLDVSRSIHPARALMVRSAYEAGRLVNVDAFPLAL